MKTTRILGLILILLTTSSFLAGCAAHLPENAGTEGIPLPTISADEQTENVKQGESSGTESATQAESQALPVPDFEQVEASVYREYYRIVDSVLVQYGYCPTIGVSSENKGLAQSVLCDFDSDGKTELLIAFWVPNQGLRVQLFGQADGKVALLLEREAPVGNDNCAGFDAYAGTEYFLEISEDSRFSEDTDRPSATGWLYKLDCGEVIATVFREVYSQPINSGDPVSDDITISYYINGEKCEEQAYFETWRSMIGEHVSFGTYKYEDADALKKVVRTLAERGGIPEEESSALIDRISALALIDALYQGSFVPQEDLDALTEPIKDFNMAKELVRQMDIPQEDQAALIDEIGIIARADGENP